MNRIAGFQAHKQHSDSFSSTFYSHYDDTICTMYRFQLCNNNFKNFIHQKNRNNTKAMRMSIVGSFFFLPIFFNLQVFLGNVLKLFLYAHKKNRKKIIIYCIGVPKTREKKKNRCTVRTEFYRYPQRIYTKR